MDDAPAREHVRSQVGLLYPIAVRMRQAWLRQGPILSGVGAPCLERRAPPLRRGRLVNLRRDNQDEVRAAIRMRGLDAARTEGRA